MEAKCNYGISYREYVFGPQTSDGLVRIELSVKPCYRSLRPGIRGLERSANCAPHRVLSGRSARSKQTVPSNKEVRS